MNVRRVGGIWFARAGRLRMQVCLAKAGERGPRPNDDAALRRRALWASIFGLTGMACAVLDVLIIHYGS